ncbi:AAA family ATPase [Desulfoscipio gibsoniae]|uniref:ATPase family protein associated with various cellular activities (AAA) n=1 Tax=Desulfoscipio gibsoniae DSM 7213 TaxID=767817 RepID=R4KNW6_9FIRM|nr:AAA family ATPase [Desulfoscipio gibsoniae]AGL03257.1 ATPase family protein associated with various cellular activities (AAA) [Desulfoscipio gibsoniae DSM 7213]
MIKQNDILKKIVHTEDYLNSFFLERETLISLLLLTIFSKQNMFILGKPGVAKTELVNQASLMIKNARIFRYLLTKYTTPEEIFGSISLGKLKEDRFYRKIDNKLADVEIGFIDEIFKGNSSILNSLLMIANEKIFINDNEVVNVPLISLFGASNEIPDDEEMEELQALYDRFTIKYIAEPIKDFRNFSRLLLSGDKPAPVADSMLLDLDELSIIYDESQNITPDQDILNLIYKIREYCYENNHYVSDRKFRNTVKVLKVCAYVNGRSSIIAEDLFIMPYMIWEKPEDFLTIKQDVQNILFDHIFNSILSKISIRVSDSFAKFLDDLILSSNNNYNEYTKCYSYLKPKQKEDLIIQYQLIREYLYKISRIVEHLEAEILSYEAKQYLRVNRLIHQQINLTINNKLAEFVSYKNKLDGLNEKIQSTLHEGD